MRDLPGFPIPGEWVNGVLELYGTLSCILRIRAYALLRLMDVRLEIGSMVSEPLQGAIVPITHAVLVRLPLLFSDQVDRILT